MADITSLAPVALSDKAKQYLQSFQQYYESLTSNTMLILRNMWNLDYVDSDTVFYDNYTYNPYVLPNTFTSSLTSFSVIPHLPAILTERRFKYEYQQVIDRISDLFGENIGDLSFFDIETQNEITFNRLRNLVHFYKNKMNKKIYDFIFYLYGLDAKVYSLGSFDYLAFYRFDTVTDLILNEYNATADGINLSYTFNLFYTTIQTNSYHLFVNGIEMGRDDGNGNIIGSGVTFGLINYNTGLVQVTFLNTPTVAQVISSTYNFIDTTDNVYSDTNILLDTGYVMSNLYKTPFIEIEINLSQYYTSNAVNYLWYDLLESYLRSQVEQIRYALSKVYYTLRLDVLGQCDDVSVTPAVITNPNNLVKSTTYNDGNPWGLKLPTANSYAITYDSGPQDIGFLFDTIHSNIERKIGYGDGSETVFRTKLIQNVPIAPLSCKLVYTIGGAEITSSNDDGAGHITGANIDIATVDYTSGEIGVSFLVTPDNETDITFYYDSVKYYFYIKHVATSDRNIIRFDITNQLNTILYIKVETPIIYTKTGNESLFTITG